MGGAEKKKPEQPRSVARLVMELFSSLLIALALAILIKWQVFDFYSIPSGSMEPTLFGIEHCGDRVFCSKQSYLFRSASQPYRYEVFVFTYPTEDSTHGHYDQNFIKRCVGLPGDTVYVSGGNLYIENREQISPRIARKPLSLQDAIWIPVYQDSFAHNSTAALAYHWEECHPTKAEGEFPKNFEELSPQAVVGSAMSVVAKEVPAASSWQMKDGALHGTAAGRSVLVYKAMTKGERLRIVPDRHVKRQVVTFLCAKDACTGQVRATVNSPQLTAFCKECGSLLTETDILEESFAAPGYERSDVGPRRLYDYNAVTDLRMTGTVQPKTAAGELLFCIYSNREVWALRLHFGTSSGLVLERNGEAQEETRTSIALPVGISQEVDFFRYDALCVARINGEEVIRHELSAEYPGRALTTYSGVALSLEEGGVIIDALGVYRDFHYVFSLSDQPERYFSNFVDPRDPAALMKMRRQLARMEESHSYIVPDDGYLAFGDNSPTSNDSRDWGPVPADNLIGPALFVWWPIHRIRILK